MKVKRSDKIMSDFKYVKIGDILECDGSVFMRIQSSDFPCDTHPCYVTSENPIVNVVDLETGHLHRINEGELVQRLTGMITTSQWESE